MAAQTSALHALLSLFFGTPSGEHINLTINNNNNVGQVAQQTSQKPSEKNTLQSFLSEVCSCKKSLVLITVSTTYLMLYVYLVRLSILLSHHECWSLWHNALPLDNLKNIPEEQLAQELVLTLERKYISFTHPMDFFTPLAAFLADVEREIYQLKRYTWLVRTLQWTGIARAFAINHELVQDANRRLERLEYFKHIFLNWAASYKLTHQQLKDSSHTSPASIFKPLSNKSSHH